MPLRVLLVAAGLAAVVWAGVRDDHVRACRSAAESVFRARDDAAAVGVARRVVMDCRGADTVAAASAVLDRAGRGDAARLLAGEAVRREPESALAWGAAGRVAQSAGDDAGLARARARLAVLDPRSTALG